MKAKQSLAGFIREHLAEIESRLENGFRQEVIVAELAEIGYQTTIQSLRNLIYRARKRRLLKTSSDHNHQKTNEDIPSKKEGSKNKRVSFEYGGTKNLDESDLI